MTRDVDGQPELEYRLHGYQVAILVLGALAVFYAAIFTPDWPVRVAILCTWGVVAAWFRCVRVEARADVLLVRNFVRTVRVPWDQVRMVQAVTDATFGPTAVVLLRTGGQIRIAALTAGRGRDGAFIPERVVELNRYRRSHHAAQPSDAVPAVAVRGDGYWAQGRAQIGVGFLIAGLLASIGGGYLLHEANRFADHGQATLAVVTDVERFNKYPTVTVEYQVDGNIFTEPAVEWLGTPKTGDHVEVVYDTTDPSHVTDAAVAGTSGALSEAVFVLLLGLASIGLAVGLLATSRR